MVRIRVIEPGFLTSVQDLGRFGFAHLGVSACGAADSLSLRAGNRLVGNPDGAAALEMTLRGGTFRFESETAVALAGAEFDASLDGQPAPFWRTLRARPGGELRIGAARTGARCYLCVARGIAVEPLLGSAATDLRAGFGGFGGRALRESDLLTAGGVAAKSCGTDAPHLAKHLRGPVIRVTANHDVTALCVAPYTVSENSNRLGIRLTGPALDGAEVLTEGVSLGAVQVPPDGQPIILFVDQQTTGGYAKLANVISADLPKVGQLRPRDCVVFEQVDYAEAIRALREQESELP